MHRPSYVKLFSGAQSILAVWMKKLLELRNDLNENISSGPSVTCKRFEFQNQKHSSLFFVHFGDTRFTSDDECGKVIYELKMKDTFRISFIPWQVFETEASTMVRNRASVISALSIILIFISIAIPNCKYNLLFQIYTLIFKKNSNQKKLNEIDD